MYVCMREGMQRGEIQFVFVHMYVQYRYVLTDY